MNNSTRQSAINIHSREEKEKGKKNSRHCSNHSAKCTRNRVHTNLIVIHVCGRAVSAWTSSLTREGFFIGVVRRVLAIRTTISISFPPFLLNQLIVSSINNLFPVNCGLHPPSC